MADISKIKVGSTTYNIKDATLRDSITGQPCKLLGRYSATDGDGYDPTNGTPGVTKSSANDSKYSAHQLGLTPNYLLFGIRSAAGAVVQIGTGSRSLQDTAVGSGQYISCATSGDNGTTSYGARTGCYIKRTATSTWTGQSISSSRHVLGPTGNTNGNTYRITFLGGLI